MAGTCLITVDQAYVDSLASIAKALHQRYAVYLKKFRELGINIESDATRNNLAFTTNAALYFMLWNEDDDCAPVHCLKEGLMDIYNFSEGDIGTTYITDSLLLESGLPLFTEELDNYIKQE